MSDTETGMLTAKSALLIAHNGIMGEGTLRNYGDEKVRHARALIETAIATLRGCAREHCSGCDDSIPFADQMKLSHLYISEPQPCWSTYEQCEIARLTRELEALR